MRSILKKGQADATNAATLVALIAALIVVYLLFLPPDIRSGILEGNTTNSTNGNGNGEEIDTTLLSEVPGLLSYLPQTEYTHDLPAFSLFIRSKSEVLKTANTFTIKNNWFDTRTKDIRFTLEDPTTVEEVILTFNTKEREGELSIWLNDILIYQADMQETNSPPLHLSSDVLRKENVLHFEVGSIGLQFWKTNKYVMEDFQIVGTVIDRSNQKSSVPFIIQSTEKRNLERARLSFTPECEEEKVGVLDITMNNIPLYSAIPDCKTRNRVSIAPGLLDAQENVLTFKTLEGSYLVDTVKVDTFLKEEPSTVYYFELDEEQYDDVQDSEKEVAIYVTLVEEDEVQEAEFIINGHTTAMRTGQDNWEKVLPKEWLVEESNYLKIDPQTDVHIAALHVELEKI